MRHPPDRACEGPERTCEKGAREQPPRPAPADPSPPDRAPLAQVTVIHKRKRVAMRWNGADSRADQARAAALRARCSSTMSIALRTDASIERKLVSSTTASGAATSGAALRVLSRSSRARISAST